eukprot:g3597.t1
MSSEFFDQYRSNFDACVRDAATKLSSLDSFDPSNTLNHEEKKDALEFVQSKINEAGNCLISMQTSGADGSNHRAQLRQCKQRHRALKKRKKKMEEEVQRQFLMDPNVSEQEKQIHGNELAEKGVDTLREGLGILDDALEEADETERELLSQGEIILGAKRKVVDTMDGLSLGARLVSQMQNRDMRNRCYITLMWIAMIVSVVSCAIYKYGDSGNSGENTTTIIIPASCTDGVQDGTETGVDCGGVCQPCQSSGGRFLEEITSF